MADVANKYPENITGKFFVDDQCIDCDLCRETAPHNFTRNEDGGHSYVFKQPESPEEEALCKEAMEGCPVEAIGNDRRLALFFLLLFGSDPHPRAGRGSVFSVWIARERERPACSFRQRRWRL